MRVEHRRVARSSHRRSAQEEPPSSKTSQDCRQRCAVKRADADNGCYNPGIRYANPLQFAEDAGAADLVSGSRLQLGISRGSPEQVIDGFRHFGFEPGEGQSDADMARAHTEEALEVIDGRRFATPHPRPMFPNPPGLLRIEPYSEGLRRRIWWGAGSNATARWAARQGMHLMSSTLKNDESGEPFHVQQRRQIEEFRSEWARHDHGFEPRVSVSRSILPIVTDEDRRYSIPGGRHDQFGHLDSSRAVFGRTYGDEPDALIEQLGQDEAIRAADTLLLTVPNQLGVEFNARLIDSVLTHIAPGLGWR